MTELNIHKEKCDSRTFMIKSTRNLKELHDYHNMMIFYANNDITKDERNFAVAQLPGYENDVIE